MSIPEFKMKWGKEDRLAHGHAWAFRNEIELKGLDPGDGALVRLLTHKGRPLGVGFLNTRANLCFRLLAPHGEFPLGTGAEEILKARLAQALDLRGPRREGEARRLVNAEGDWLGGLVVDDYNGVLVIQVQTSGMERRRALILDLLKGQPGVKAVVDRSDPEYRAKEGLPPSAGVAWMEGVDEHFLARVPFVENGLQFTADVVNGHKTGFFLDQRPARALARGLATGRRCLDVFCHTGGFAVGLAAGGAKSVLGIDQSSEVLDLARAHAHMNQVEACCTFEQADAFTHLREMEKAGERFGLVVLDPPALAREGGAALEALRGYKELNLRALRLLEPGGLLLTCSCSASVDEGRFSQAVQAAAVDAPATLREVERFGAGGDHPRLLGFPEGRHLKCLLLRKG